MMWVLVAIWVDNICLQFGESAAHCRKR